MNILHKFRNHSIAPDTRILIVGTFNPDIPGGPDFFYGRSRNHLWRLLPVCFEEQELSKSALPEKKLFVQRNKIDFVDIIKSMGQMSGENLQLF